MDEPEAISGISLAAREGLDNLTFVVNCNLQRLDGPVRGNGKIIQELEGLFRGAGWNVIKVIWGREWDDLLARDVDGVLVEKMNTHASTASSRSTRSRPAPTSASTSSARTRASAGWSSTCPTTSSCTCAAAATTTTRSTRPTRPRRSSRGAPTVILAKTVKGWTLGRGVEARNITHQAKKLREDELRVFRDRLELPIPDDQLKDAPYFHPGPDSDEVRVHAGAPGGPRRSGARAGSSARRRCPRPAPEVDAEFDGGSATAVSTTMVFARLLRNLIRDPQLGRRIVPIIPDEARTFGLDPLFKEVGIYAAHGQRYDPVDSDLVLSYREATRRPGARGGDQRGGLDGLAPGRRHGVRDARRADDPLLHLLLDVRVPADRRPGLGLRRPARAAAS